MQILDRSRHVVLLSIVGIALTIALAGCLSDDRKESDSMATQDIKTVMEANVDELMAIPGVTAVAIGALEDGTACIRVYVIESSKEIRESIPANLEGHPVVVEVSGEIRPLSED